MNPATLFLRLPVHAATIGSTIAEAVSASKPGSRTCIVQVSNARLEDPSDSAIVAYESDGSGAWTRTDAAISVDPAALNLFLSAIEDDIPIVDFDLHLDDVSQDWRNEQVPIAVSPRSRQISNR